MADKKILMEEYNKKSEIYGINKEIDRVSTNREKIKNNFTGAFFTFDNIVGESDSIKKIIENSKIVADSPSTILIQGESGTGKEVLAQAIHNYSKRKNSKFIAVNCGAIPQSIMESEFFGYEDGTFTGGKKGGKLGKVEMANGGTLFLDEIGDMPLEMQVKLLRVLQEGRITKLGGSEEIKVDVRVIAATNKNLKEEVKNGRFREDLFYRLCVIPINLPPLRERNDDIKLLINYFLENKCIKLGKELIYIKDDLYKSLLNCKWKGNIRQLENYIENIVNLNGNLSPEFQEECEYINKVEEDYNYKQIIEKEIEVDNKFNLNYIEKQTILKALTYNEYNITRTAKSLGISRNTLYLKIKKYNIATNKNDFK